MNRSAKETKQQQQLTPKTLIAADLDTPTRPKTRCLVLGGSISFAQAVHNNEDNPLRSVTSLTHD